MEYVQGMRWPIEEVRIAKGHMTRAQAHLLVNIGEYDITGHHKKTALVYRRDGTMQTGMQASSGRLRVSGKEGMVSRIQMGIPFKFGQLATIRFYKGLTGEMRRGYMVKGTNTGHRYRRIGFQGANQIQKRLFIFTADYRLGAMR
jgi:hypothetical protein